MKRPAEPPPGLAVVKLGGSFMASPHLRPVLDAICASSCPAVIVPGGGPFADAVRSAQTHLGFGDGTAHRMALLAMAQFAELLAGLEPRLRIASGLAAVRAALALDAAPVWSPWPLADGLNALPGSWELTSDSLAAWLASRLGAERLILLKHRDPPDAISLRQAADAGVVDVLFPAFATAFLVGSSPSPGRRFAASALSRQGRGQLLAVMSAALQPGTVMPSPLAGEGGRRRRPGEGAGVASIRWLGPAQFSMLTAILDGCVQAGLQLHASVPDPLPA